MNDPIRTSYDYPPIPARDADWSAWRDPEGITGRGATEEAAIADFLDQEAEQMAEKTDDEFAYRDALVKMGAEQMARDRKRIRELESALEGLVRDRSRLSGVTMHSEAEVIAHRVLRERRG